MPSTQIEPDNGNEALEGVIDGGHGKECFGVRHKAVLVCQLIRSTCIHSYQKTDFVILSSMDRGSRMKVGKATRLRSAPGRNWEMICERTALSISETLV